MYERGTDMEWTAGLTICQHMETEYGMVLEIQPTEDAEHTAAHVRIAGCKRLLAIYQHKEWWVRPSFPKELKDVPKRTQLLLMEGEKEYLAVLAVCGSVCRTDMEGCAEGLKITMSSNCCGRKSEKDFAIAVASGKDPWQCCEDAARCALEELGYPHMLRRQRRYPAMFEKFGWCSWDAFYQKVSAQGITDKLNELKEKRLPAKWVLIDDGWLDADYEKQLLCGMDAAQDKFPDGLGSFVKRIKEEYGLEQVGVWHAVMGYWNGLQKDSPVYETQKDVCAVLPDGRIVVETKTQKAFLFYHRWHEYLKNQCGIDFVKVDGQSSISDFYAGIKSYGEAGEAIQTGLNASAALHFDNRIINCMGMAPQDMWKRPDSAIARSSDDFLPKASHGFWEHAIQNGYNSLLQGQFFWGDWDMFWSEHEESRQNALLRAVSGGPVYTSDPVGKTDPMVIRPLIKQDGTVIRCSSIGMPTKDCLFENPLESSRPLKLFNRYGDNFVLAAFDLGSEDAVKSGTIRLSDMPGTEGKKWILWEHGTQQAIVLQDEDCYEFKLAPNGAALFVLLPYDGFAPVGILEKYIAPGCIRFVNENAERTLVAVDETGTFGFASDREPVKILCDGTTVAWQKAGFFYQVKCDTLNESKRDCLLEIIWQRD